MDNKNITNEECIKNTRDYFAPYLIYEKFKKGHSNISSEEKISSREMRYMGQFSSDSEVFMFKAWKSFLEAKATFLEGGESIKEIYLNKNGKFGLNNYGYISFARTLFNLVRLSEQYVNNINFILLKKDPEYKKKSNTIFTLGHISEKEKLIEIRNAIAHNRYTLYVKDNVPRISLIVGDKNKNLDVSFKSLSDYVDIVCNHIDPSFAQYFNKRDHEKACDIYKKMFGLKVGGDISGDKKDILDFLYKRNEKSNKQIKADINTQLNNLILQYPDYTKDQIFDLLYLEIRKSYSVFNEDKFLDAKPDKRNAVFFVENEKMIKAEDALEVAQYVFSTKRYRSFTHKEGLSQEIKDFFYSKFDIEKIIKDKNLCIKEHDTYYFAFLENIRHSIFHDKAIIAPDGKIIFQIQNNEGKKSLNDVKSKIRKLDFTAGSYQEKLYNINKQFKNPNKTLVTICELSPEELIEICEYIMNGGTPIKIEQQNKSTYHKQKNDQDSQIKTAINKKARKREIYKERKDKIKARNSKQNQNKTKKDDEENQNDFNDEKE